jgi:hypothetical protein
VNQGRKPGREGADERAGPQRGRIACGLLWASVLVTSGAVLPAQEPAAISGAEPAYYEGKVVRFTPVAAKRAKTLVVSDVPLGPVLSDDKPNDHRPNVYVVCPGAQPRLGKDGLTFNLVLSSLPRTEEPVEWDIYWVVVLDPAVRTGFTGEMELLLAAQKGFTPGGEFGLADVPGAALLRKYLHIDSLAALAPFGRSGGDLPELMIVPSHIAVRASAVDPGSENSPVRITAPSPGPTAEPPGSSAK